MVSVGKKYGGYGLCTPRIRTGGGQLWWRGYWVVGRDEGGVAGGKGVEGGVAGGKGGGGGVAGGKGVEGGGELCRSEQLWWVAECNT